MKSLVQHIYESSSYCKHAQTSSYYKHALNYLLGQPGWNMKNAEKYLNSLSDREIERLAHKDM